MPYQPPVDEASTKNTHKNRLDLLLSSSILLLLMLSGILIFLLGVFTYPPAKEQTKVFIQVVVA